MKRFLVCFTIAFVAIFIVTSGAMATVVTLDADTYCNDYQFGVQPSGLANSYGAHGVEYGCGDYERVVHGAIYVAGGIAYFGFDFHQSDVGDYGQLGAMSVAVDMGTNTCSGVYQYFYFSGGTLTGHGGSDTYTMSIGGGPSAAMEGGADSTLP